MRKRCARCAVFAAAAALLLAAVFILISFDPFGEKVYTSEDFGINTVHSAVDFNGNGIDDYTDLLLAQGLTLKTIRNMIRPIMRADIRLITSEYALMLYGELLNRQGIRCAIW